MTTTFKLFQWQRNPRNQNVVSRIALSNHDNTFHFIGRNKGDYSNDDRWFAVDWDVRRWDVGTYTISSDNKTKITFTITASFNGDKDIPQRDFPNQGSGVVECEMATDGNTITGYPFCSGMDAERAVGGDNDPTGISIFNEDPRETAKYALTASAATATEIAKLAQAHSPQRALEARRQLGLGDPAGLELVALINTALVDKQFDEVRRFIKMPTFTAAVATSVVTGTNAELAARFNHDTPFDITQSLVDACQGNATFAADIRPFVTHLLSTHLQVLRTPSPGYDNEKKAFDLHNPPTRFLLGLTSVVDDKLLCEVMAKTELPSSSPRDIVSRIGDAVSKSNDIKLIVKCLFRWTWDFWHDDTATLHKFYAAIRTALHIPEQRKTAFATDDELTESIVGAVKGAPNDDVFIEAVKALGIDAPGAPPPTPKNLEKMLGAAMPNRFASIRFLMSLSTFTDELATALVKNKTAKFFKTTPQDITQRFVTAVINTKDKTAIQQLTDICIENHIRFALAQLTAAGAKLVPDDVLADKEKGALHFCLALEHGRPDVLAELLHTGIDPVEAITMKKGNNSGRYGQGFVDYYIATSSITDVQHSARNIRVACMQRLHDCTMQLLSNKKVANELESKFGYFSRAVIFHGLERGVRYSAFGPSDHDPASYDIGQIWRGPLETLMRAFAEHNKDKSNKQINFFVRRDENSALFFVLWQCVGWKDGDATTEEIIEEPSGSARSALELFSTQDGFAAELERYLTWASSNKSKVTFFAKSEHRTPERENMFVAAIHKFVESVVGGKK